MKPPTSTLFPYTIALPILAGVRVGEVHAQGGVARAEGSGAALQTDHLGAGVEQAPGDGPADAAGGTGDHGGDRKSTRLNSSHVAISYAVFCLKKKKTEIRR